MYWAAMATTPMYDKPSLSRLPNADGFKAGGRSQQRTMDPKDRISAWKRWEMTSFAQVLPTPAGAPAQALPESPEPAERIDAELDRLRLEAQLSGEKSGHQQGHQQGYAQGYAQGQAAAMASVNAQAAELRALTLSLPSALRTAEATVADDLLALAMDLARQVLGQALAAEPQIMLAVVHELLQAEPALVGSPQLFLHPDDVLLVREHLSDDLQAVGWRIRSDTSIQRGGCRVMATSGERDATLETRWTRVAATLTRHAPVSCAVPHD